MKNEARQLGSQFAAVGGLSGSLGATGSALRRQLWIWPILAALVLGAIGWWVHRSVENVMRENIAGALQTILNADVKALDIWTRDQAALARALARAPVFQPSVRQLLAVAAQPDAPPGALLQSRALVDVRDRLRPFLTDFGYTDFLIVTPGMRVIAAKDDTPLNSVVDGYRSAFFLKVLKEGAAVSMPFRSTLLLTDTDGQRKAGLPTMLAAAVMPDETGKPLAMLALRIRPEMEFSSILQTARFGNSGETYVVSETGLLLSESRFDADLKRLGLLADLPDSRSILTVEVRDPQVNMLEDGRPTLARAEQPLTKLAANIVAGANGVEMVPYGDYRGVPSVGAYKWLPEYGFGVATEVDVADAFRPLYVLRRAIWALLALLVLSAGAIFLAMVVVARQQRRAARAETLVKELGQYTLEEKIGSGGMGSVYRARHAFLRRPTAVKMLNGDNVGESSLARFEREVQLTSRLNHPNTIAVYDFGRTRQGVFYYAMEYLDGIDLEELVKQFGPLPEGRVISILQQVCGSLDEAHSIGLIHRDIKPANIILTLRAGIPDFVKVLDFGLVKQVDTEVEAKLTQANTSVGTPYYMSPEAIERPDAVTALSDIYAIGAVGYFLLTGTTVFSGKTIMDVCMKQVRAAPEPPSSRLGHAVGERLESAILRCLAKDTMERPPGAQALLEELVQCQPLQSWSRAEALAWWSTFKTTVRPNPATAPTIEGQVVSTSME